MKCLFSLMLCYGTVTTPIRILEEPFPKVWLAQNLGPSIVSGQAWTWGVVEGNEGSLCYMQLTLEQDSEIWSVFTFFILDQALDWLAIWPAA